MEPFSTYRQESGQQIVFVKLEKVRGEGRGVLWSLSTQKIIVATTCLKVVVEEEAWLSVDKAFGYNLHFHQPYTC